MSDGSLEAKLLSKLNETGFVFEMRAAAAARSALPDLLYVHQGRQYIDTESGKVRESDVLLCDAAYGADWQFFHYAVAECKSGPDSWTVFVGGKPSGRQEADAATRLTRLKETVRTASSGAPDLESIVGAELFPGPTLLDLNVHGYGVASPFKSNPGEPGNALRQALSAATGFVTDIDAEFDEVYSLLVTPVVLLSAPLFAVWLGAGNEPALQRVGAAEVSVRSGVDDLYTVHIVQEEEWPEWLQRYRATTDALRPRA
jgi:hypothetical protein